MERAPGTHWIGGWVDDLENRTSFTLPGLELQPLGRPAPWQVAMPTELSRLTQE
jgi:hypothetical protein